MKHPAFIFLFLFTVCINQGQTLQHECGLALLRLRKPLSYYQEQYGDIGWGIHKLFLLMEKQRNRGQESAGFSVMQCDMPAGYPFMKRYRAIGKNALESLCTKINTKLNESAPIDRTNNLSIKQSCSLIGELYLGHLRYATHGGNNLKFAQPHHYKNNIRAKCLIFAGNFNMTNCPDILKQIVSYGLNPSSNADTHVITHQLSYYIEQAYDQALAVANRSKLPPAHASNTLDIVKAIKNAASNWDGGYVFAGIIGNGDAFICRDPAGIRPGYYYMDEEIFAAASERSALMSTFNLAPEHIHEIPPAHMIVIKKDGTITHHQFTPLLPEQQCVFERIYFSRPNDPDIYKERKLLGKNLAQRLLVELDHDTSHSVFSYIPNSAEISFHGLVEELNQLNFNYSYNQLTQSGKKLSEQEIISRVHNKIHVAKLIFKDQAIRTFIANDKVRSNLIANVYDVTRGVVTDQDTIVALDDSIVRGNTLRKSIIKQLITLNPKKIIISSAAPIILYPDCYGIDISQISKLIGFQAAIALTKERGNQALIDDLFLECTRLKETDSISFYNPIKKLYDQFTQQELEEKVAELVYPHDSSWNKELKVMYQTVDGMHNAIPNYKGDWYFTGNYPTLGGYKVVINSFINWYTAKTIRAY